MSPPTRSVGAGPSKEPTTNFWSPMIGPDSRLISSSMAVEPLQTSSAPSVIELTAAPAVVVWPGPNGQVHQLCQNERDQVTFDIHFNAASETAFFKLRVPVKLKDFPHEKTPLFLYIHPDRVTSLVYDGPDKMPDDIRQKLGTDAIICLRFSLNKPADMVVPRASSLTPRRQRGHGDKLDCLRLLAQETSLSVYLTLQDSLSEVLFRSLCAAVTDGTLQALDGAADMSGLYSGTGGEVLQVGNPCPPPMESPPSYDELGASPPSASLKDGKIKGSLPIPYMSPHTADIFSKLASAQASTSKKRRRGSPSDAAGADSDPGAHSMEATCRKLMQDMMYQFRQEERAYLRSELQQMKTEITEYVDSRLDRVVDNLDVYSVDEVDERIEEVRQCNEDMVDVKVEDRVDYVKLELEEYVEDQIVGAEERLLGRLRTASLCLEIQDD